MRFSSLIAVCILAAACVSTNVERLDDTVRPARAPDSVSLLEERPQRPYTVIAVIESKGKSAFDSFEEMRQELIAEAAALGGDAVILGPEFTESNFLLIGTAMIQSDTKKQMAEVIVFEKA